MANRFKRMLFKNAFLCIYLNAQAKKIAKKDVLSDAERYRLAINFVKKYHRDMKVVVKSYGMENMDWDMKGCLIVGNHQSKGDATAILQTLENFPTSFVIDDKKSHQFVFGNVCDMMHGKRIKFDDLKSQVVIYNEMAEELKQGRSFIVFPEAGYDNNQNNIQGFNTPCFAPAIKSHCPILPFVVYDTYKIFENGPFVPLEVECHLLKPIYYEEYKNMNKQQLAQFVEARIVEKLEEIKKSKQIEIKL